MDDARSVPPEPAPAYRSYWMGSVGSKARLRALKNSPASIDESSAVKVSPIGSKAWTWKKPASAGNKIALAAACGTTKRKTLPVRIIDRPRNRIGRLPGRATPRFSLTLTRAVQMIVAHLGE